MTEPSQLAQDYDLVMEALLDHFPREEIDKLGILTRTFDSQLRRELATISFKFFKRYYLPQYFPVPDGEMHEQLTKDIEIIASSKKGVRESVAWPRGTGKTTTCDLALPLWIICTKKYHYIILITDSLGSGKTHLRAIKDELEVNERILADFGALKGPKWQEDEIITNTEIMMTVLGARTQIRGRKFKQWRPELIICDDLEDDVSVRSDVQRLYLREWFFKAVLKAGTLGQKTSYFYIGTKLHFDCLLAHLLQHPGFFGKTYVGVKAFATNEELWEQWEKIYTNLQDPRRKEHSRDFFDQHTQEMLEGAETTWEGLEYYDLMIERVDIGRAAFATEVQNEPMDPATRRFSRIGQFRRLMLGDVEWFQPVEIDPNTGDRADDGIAVRAGDCRYFMTVDPSLGQSMTGDPSAIQVLAKDQANRLYSVECAIKLRKPDRLISDIISTFSRYPRTVRVGVESNAFQLLLKMNLQEEAAKEGINLPVFALTNLGNKDARIESLQPDLENGYLLIGVGQTILYQQLSEWPASSHDDGPDALEMGRTVARKDVIAQPTIVMAGDQHKFGTLFVPGAEDEEEGGEIWAPRIVRF